MEASELRIGNYVMIDDGRNDGDIIRITGTNTINGGHVYDEDGDIFGCDMIKPIPLNEQWLIDFGFEKINDHIFQCRGFEYSHLFTKMAFHLSNMEFIIVLNDYDGFEVEVKYVHQLQNLYFALTGEELIIKEKVR